MEPDEKLLLEQILVELRLSNTLATLVYAAVGSRSGSLAETQLNEKLLREYTELIQRLREERYATLAQEIYPDDPEAVERLRARASQTDYIK